MSDGALHWAACRAGKVRRKEAAPSLLAWAEEPALAAELGGPAGVAACVLRALLVAGAKSFTHMLIALERYQAALVLLLAAAGPEVLPHLLTGRIQERVTGMYIWL